MAKHNFPRVNTTITAKTRTVEVVNENPRVPVLFAPIVSNKGPYTVTKVRSIAEFVEIFGELDYYKQGQDTLNLYQWLGGRIPYNGYAWIKRIEPAFVGETDEGKPVYVEDFDVFNRATVTWGINFTEGDGEGGGEAPLPDFELKFEAYDTSSIFADYRIRISQNKDAKVWTNSINITIEDEKRNIVSEIVNVNEDNYPEKFAELNFFGVELLTEDEDGNKEWFEQGKSLFDNKRYLYLTPAIAEGLNGEISGLHPGLKIDDIFEAMKVYYASKARTELEDMLSYPISIILDGNYPIDLKQEIIEFIDDVRDDVHFMLSRAEYATKTIGEGAGAVTVINPDLIIQEIDETDFKDDILDMVLPENGNVAIWAADRLSATDSRLLPKDVHVVVSSIYSLASKIPENDFKYGIWWNFVGPRRGIVDEEVLNTNTSFQKNKYVDELTNYIEKTSRDQVFMLQRTTGRPKTAFVQLHASRLTQYLRREIRWIARNYLFEFNDIDSTTYVDVKNEIRRFLNQFAKIAIDMSTPYNLDVYKTGENSFQIAITGLKYKDVVEKIDLLIQLD